MTIDRRLIENFIPIREFSAEAAREKSIRKGHISTLYLWQTLALEKLAEAVQQLTPTNIEAPNYQQTLESFGNFDWQSISARVESCDRYGVALVSWRGLIFTLAIAIQQIW